MINFKRRIVYLCLHFATEPVLTSWRIIMDIYFLRPLCAINIPHWRQDAIVKRPDIHNEVLELEIRWTCGCWTRFNDQEIIEEFNCLSRIAALHR